ncbi:MAG: UbiX family flavin prenyltransferase [Acidobacteriota bacterium]
MAQRAKPSDPEPSGRTLVVAATGASGARLAVRFLGHLLAHPGVGAVHFVGSHAFALVAAREEGRKLPEMLKGLPGREKLHLYQEEQLDACVSSGSFPVDGTVIIPASMSTVGAVASGAGRTLCHRVAEVALKERRPLILVPRETPLSLIHLRNLATLAEAGALVAPFIPAFYQRPGSVEALMDHFFMRLFDHLGLPSALSTRWS